MQSIPSLPRASSLTTDATSEHLETSNVSTITESLLEGVVGSFGRWIGADKIASKGSNGSPLVELRAALNQNEELVSAHRKNTKPLDSVSPSDADLAKNIDDWEW